VRLHFDVCSLPRHRLVDAGSLLLVLALATADAAAAGAPAVEPGGTPAAPGVKSEGESASAQPLPPRPHLAAMAFALERRPRAQRTQRWTQARHGFAPSWEKQHPGAHFSRFLELARPEIRPPKARVGSPAETRLALLQFASAIIADLRDGIAAACPRGRCAAVITEAGQRLATIAEAGARAVITVDDTSADHAAGVWHGWRLQGRGVAVELGCDDIADLPEIRCRLDLDLGEGRVLRFTPRTSPSVPGPDFVVRQRDAPAGVNLGEIQFDRTYGGAPVVIIAGTALAAAKTQPTPDENAEAQASPAGPAAASPPALD
jgi:hypothetical protein